MKLHAKLDHKNVVRYYSTWEESPPPGWQEDHDAWFADMELGTPAQTSDHSVTDISFSLSRDQPLSKSTPKVNQGGSAIFHHGVGDEDFSAMKTLDGDERKIGSRDILHCSVYAEETV